MPNNKELADFVMDQLSGCSDIRKIAMMGGYLFYYQERIFGGIYGNGFMVKDTKASRKYMPDSEPEPPYKGAKPMLPVTILENKELLQKMVEEMYQELPERKPNKKDKKVLNFGSLNLDYVYSVDHMVKPGETLASIGMQVFCGGKGLNQSIALAKAGVSVYHAGMIGEEGTILLEACKKAGVNAEYIRTIPGKSGHTVIQVDKNGQNCILLFGGANRSMTKEYVDLVFRGFRKGDILLLQNEVNLIDYMIDRAYRKGMNVVLNPSPYDHALDTCDFQKVSMFLLNEVEGEQITGEKDPEKILAKIKKLYPEAKTILTLGEKGSIYQHKDERYRQEIYQVKAVDTTAAGDTFTGYFISSVIKGMPVPDGLALAAKASAIAVSRKGAAASIPFQEEVEKTVW